MKSWFRRYGLPLGWKAATGSGNLLLSPTMPGSGIVVVPPTTHFQRRGKRHDRGQA